MFLTPLTPYLLDLVLDLGQVQDLHGLLLMAGVPVGRSGGQLVREAAHQLVSQTV